MTHLDKNPHGLHMGMSAIGLACLLATVPVWAQTYSDLPETATAANAAQYTFTEVTPALLNEAFTTGAASDTFNWNGTPPPKPWNYANMNRLSPVTYPIPVLKAPPWSATERSACFNTGTKDPGQAISYLDLTKSLTLKTNGRYVVTANVGTVTGQAATFTLSLGNNMTPSIIRTFTVPAVSSGHNKTQVKIDGIFLKPSGATNDAVVAFRFTDTQNVEVCVDDVKVSEVAADPMNPMANLTIATGGPVSPVRPQAVAKPIGSRFFGYNANMWNQSAWPPLGQTVQRLWDNGVYWGALQPTLPSPANALDATASARLNHFINIASASAGASPDSRPVPLILTLGMTPKWATGNPACTTVPAYPDSCSLPPNDASLPAWREYIKAVALLQPGKIKYFELWNEPDIGNIHFEGTGQRLAVLAQHAKQALQDADPTNQYGFKLVGPSVTRAGMRLLDEFLTAGGGQHVDIFSFHAGYVAIENNFTGDEPLLAEYDLPAVTANIKARIHQQDPALTAKPLWNTEGQTTCIGACPPSTNMARGLLFRSLLTMWSNGVDNFNPHAMEGPERPSILWSAMADAPGYTTLTPFGQGYAAAASWFKNATLSSSYYMPSSRIYVHHVTLSGGQKNYVLWTTSSSAVTVRLPNAPSIFFPQGWNVSTIVALDGGTSAVPSPNRLITLQPFAPVKLIP